MTHHSKAAALLRLAVLSATVVVIDVSALQVASAQSRLAVISDSAYIPANTELKVNQRFWSRNKSYFLTYQADGNLVLYRSFVSGGRKKMKALWATGTDGWSVGRAIFQGDGNLVLYYTSGGAAWASASDKDGREFDARGNYLATGVPSTWLAVQDDGNLVIYAGTENGGYAKWSSRTAVR